MANKALLELFRAKASEIGERPFDHLTEEDCISSLGFDSLNLIELTASIERELKIRIPEERLIGVLTIGQFLSVVEALVPPALLSA